MHDQLAELGESLRIVVVDDDPAIIDTITVYLEEEKQVEFRVARDGEGALALVAEFRPHILLSDIRMPGMTGLEILKQTKLRTPEVEVVMMTAHASAESAVEAMREGAYDYLIKPFRIIELKSVLGKILRTRLLERQNSELRSRLARYELPRRIAGCSSFAEEARRFVATVAATNASVLITGDSGTGKSLLAEAIHEAGPRSAHAFVTIECAAIPRDLLESELFGYERGAFTGADRAKEGRLERAEGGTVFLDEIGDMPLELQAKLLRVIQERELTRVGGGKPKRIDVRFISATNRDLAALVRGGRFREDLFYRLNVVPFRMHALRERTDDLPELIAYLAEKLAARSGREVRVSPALIEQATGYGWPGNVRELENVLERSLVFSAGPLLEELLLPEPHGEAVRYLTPQLLAELPFPPDGVSLDALEGALARRALELASGDRAAAAALLGVDARRFGVMSGATG